MSFPFKHADAHQIRSVLPVLVLMLLLAFGRPVIAQDCEIQQITFGLDDLSLPGPPPSVCTALAGYSRSIKRPFGSARRSFKPPMVDKASSADTLSRLKGN